MMARPSGGMRRAIVADDDPNIRRVVEAALARNFPAADVVLAENGRIALDAMREAPADLLIADLVMPTMDGVALVKTVREDAVLGRTPILVMTALSHCDQRSREVMSFRDVRILHKPFPLGVLMRTVMRQMAGGLPGGIEDDALRTSSRVLDLEELQEDFFNDSDFLAELLECLRLDLPDALDRLENLMRYGDAEAAEIIAHRLRGTAANVRAAPLMRASQQMEEVLRAKDLEAAWAALPAVQSEVERLTEALDKAIRHGSRQGAGLSPSTSGS